MIKFLLEILQKWFGCLKFFFKVVQIIYVNLSRFLVTLINVLEICRYTKIVITKKKTVTPQPPQQTGQPQGGGGQPQQQPQPTQQQVTQVLASSSIPTPMPSSAPPQLRTIRMFICCYLFTWEVFWKAFSIR